MSSNNRKKREEQEKQKRQKEFKKFIKKCLIAYAIFLVIGTVVVTALLSTTRETRYPSPTSNFFVEDYSGVFSESTEQYIMDQAVALWEATKAQVVVAAVPNTHVDSLEKYSYELANQWGIGDAELDNGVLILFTTEEAHVRLEVGKGLEGCLPDGKAGRILDDYAVDDKDNGRWNKAAINTWVATAKAIYEEYGVKAPDTLVFVDTAEENSEGKTMADADFPKVYEEKNQEPLYIQILTGFFVTLIFGSVGFWFICWLIRICSTGSGSSSSGNWYNSGGYSSGGSGGYSGGGGSFGGGGASR